MMIYLGQLLIGIGIVFITFGLISILRFRDFYTRVLISSEVDTVGMICIYAGVMLIGGISFFSVKVFLVLTCIAFTGPLITHYIARAAYFSEHSISKEENSHDT